MVVRDISTAVYHQIINEGLLSQRRMDTYAVIHQHGPMTASEALDTLVRANGSRSRTDSQIRARCFELREMGVIKENQIRYCKITGREVIEWEVTNLLPKPLPAKTSEPERLRNLVLRMTNKLGWIKDVIEKQIAAGKPVSESGKKWLRETAAILDEVGYSDRNR